MMKYKKICITGADGFIGSHLTEYCVRKGYDVRAFCLYNSFGRPGWLENSQVAGNVEIFWGDVRDPFRMRAALEGCDAVMHLAALISIPYSYQAPESYVETNIQGTLNVLQAARAAGLARVIHTSTSEVYGTAQTVPISEMHPLNAQSPYAASKIGADQMAMSFYRSFGVPVSILRPFNTYGPRQSTRAVIPTIITQLANGSSTLKLGNLCPTRDLTYVEDTAAAFEAVLNADACVGNVVNGGTGYETSIGDLAALIIELMGGNAEIICEKSRLRPKDSEVERLLADNSRIRDLCGWIPAHSGRTGLIAGLKMTIEWFSNPDNLKNYPANIYNM